MRREVWLLLLLHLSVCCCELTVSPVTNGKIRIPVKPHDMVPRHLGHLLVNVEHKFIFCPIEKVASTQYRQLFQRMAGDELWFLPPYHVPNRTRLIDMDMKTVEEILHDDSWTKAVFFRDPAKRFSVLIVAVKVQLDSKKFYKILLAKRHLNSTWTDFWRSALAPRGIRNIHWDPQISFCGLNKFWPLFNFVGNFEKLSSHSALLSRRLGIDKYTNSSWALTRMIQHPLSWRLSKEEKLRRVRNARIPDDYNKGDCMWCKNHAVHKNDYNTNPVAKYLEFNVWRYIRKSRVYRADYKIMSAMKTPPFNNTIHEIYALP